MAGPHTFSAEPRILVITLMRLGDVLLATPLVRALKRGIPGARIDMLVFRGTEGILAGNPDIERVIAIPPRPKAKDIAPLLWRLWRSYDLSVCTQTGDRPTMIAWATGRYRVGVAPADRQPWKRRAFHRSVDADLNLHRVVELLGLARLLGIEAAPGLVVPQKAQLPAPRPPYAVLHAHPFYCIRRWHDDGWRALARALRERGLAVIATGGPSPEERNYLDRLWAPVKPVVERLDAKLDWPALAQLMSAAAVYVGPDTSMTHLAAGAGAPTVAIYGPGGPQNMGPWPAGGLREPWARAGTIQNRGNVWLVQNPLPCMPCDLLGCERHLESYSACLDELPIERVLDAVDRAMGAKAVA